VLVRIVGGPPLLAKVARLGRLRCCLCLTIFTAKAPVGMGEGKYDATAVSMMVLLRYGTGLPLNRLEKLQESLGIPLPASTQWDVAARNVSKDFETILCNCMSHSRRQYVDVVEDFPQECRFVLETLAEVFKNDAQARQEGMSPQERMEFHRRESLPLMAKLRLWSWKEIKERRIEPNSGLGKAIKYMRKHWRKLVRFLYVPGAPLSNNLCERILKKAIIHRKGSLFYKTRNGARVGDIYMSLIATCQIMGVNAFEYLTEIQRHAAEVAADPARWMPWNYREALQSSPVPAPG
jgi:hypothetical protein